MSNIRNMEINMALYSAMRGVLSNEECLAVIDSLCQTLYYNRNVEGLTQKEQSFFEPLLKEATERAASYTKRLHNLKQNKKDQ